MLHSNITVNEKGHLVFAGCDTMELADRFGTALYLLDEDRIRENSRKYTQTMRRCFRRVPARCTPAKRCALSACIKPFWKRI